MYTIKKTINTETGHRLINYKGKCAHLHGHRYEWTVEVKSVNIDEERGMFIDFKDLKSIMKKTIFDVFDHSFVLCTGDPILKLPNYQEFFRASDGEPGRLVVIDLNPTAENLTRTVFEYIKPYLDKDVFLNNVILKETESSMSVYCDKYWS